MGVELSSSHSVFVESLFPSLWGSDVGHCGMDLIWEFFHALLY